MRIFNPIIIVLLCFGFSLANPKSTGATIMSVDGPIPAGNGSGSDTRVDSLRNADNDRRDALIERNQPGIQANPSEAEENAAYERYRQMQEQFRLDSIQRAANLERNQKIYDNTQRIIQNSNSTYDEAARTVEEMDLSKQNEKLQQEIKDLMPVVTRESSDSKYVEEPDAMDNGFFRVFFAGLLIVGGTLLFLWISDTPIE